MVAASPAPSPAPAAPPDVAGAAGEVPYFLTPTHLVTLALVCAGIGVVSYIGARTRGTTFGRRWRVGVGAATLVGTLGVMVFWLTPGWYDLRISLPLHLCDVAALLAPLAIILKWRPARAVLHFWGLGLSTQGFLTPTMDEGPTSPVFWAHWVNHTVIVGGAVYDVWAGGYRPRWRDWGIALALGLVYVAVMVPVNVATGWNYGFVGPSLPSERTLIDVLGAWPLRIVWMVLLAGGLMTVMMLAWEVGYRVKGRGVEVGEGEEPQAGRPSHEDLRGKSDGRDARPTRDAGESDGRDARPTRAAGEE